MKNVHFIFNYLKPCISVVLSLVGLAMALNTIAQPSTLQNHQLETRNAMEYFFNKSFNNLSEELQAAREQGKSGILIMFTEPDCPWCHKMEATILNQKSVQEFYRNHFRILNIDTKGDTLMTNFDDKEMAEKDFSLKIHRIRATPVFLFFDLNGKVVMRYTGAAPNIEEFMWLGEFVVDGEFKTTKFTRYKQRRLAEKKASTNS